MGITGKKTPARRMRAWPAIVAPIGLAALLGAAGWLFTTKIRADQNRADAGALRLEGYARLEAGELAGRSAEAARAFLEERTRKRAEQERNMRVELRSVMDAVYRVLSAGLEKTRSGAGAHRDVGEFPSGFESLRLFLELSDNPAVREDAPIEALRACSPELTALLPPGCSLTVVENNFEELLSLGGGAASDNARTETMAREFIWDDGEQSRQWTLQVRLAETDEFPMPDARELAAHLDRQLGSTQLADAGWRGWLVDPSGQAAAAFPIVPDGAAAGSPTASAAPPPYIDMPNEWVEIDGRRLVWLERGRALEHVGLTPAVAVAIDRPAPPLSWRDELAKDNRWSLTLGSIGLLTLGTWLWFFRALWQSRRRASAERLESLLAAGRAEAAARAAENDRPRRREIPEARAARTGAFLAAEEVRPLTSRARRPDDDAPRRRLVRDESGAKTAPAGSVIVADIGPDGDVEVGAEIVHETPTRRLVMPTGSLLRLQERHRGGRNRRGSRVLDRARSQLLRELATRVRPVLTASPLAPPPPPPEQGVRAGGRAGRATERILPKKV